MAQHDLGWIANVPDQRDHLIVRNSWGPGWRLQGYFTMPCAYLTDGNPADDFWTVRLIAN